MVTKLASSNKAAASGSTGAKQMSDRLQVNMRISEEGKELLAAFQEHFGLSQSGVIELLLREKAREVVSQNPMLLHRFFPRMAAQAKK